ncbi:MAG TPA: hypothetical protein P5056_01690 [Candidatus Paceibacterota bacterium]|nr:hypothetical protein [Candidatus Paceibacterota bacterium]
MEILTKYFGFKKILSIFPELYNYAGYSPLLLRLSVGVIYFGDGLQDLKKKSGTKIFNTTLGVLKIISGLFLFFGLYAQLWAIVAICLSIFNIFLSVGEGNWQKLKYNFLILTITASLMLSGPGLYALDLPL